MRTLKDLLLAEPKLTLAVAESLTCGQLQALIGAEPGASAYFLGGITTYSLAQKARHLGVDREHAGAVNSVSPRVAEEMARGVRTLFGSAVGAATTGYAERSPADGVAAPFAYWAIAYPRHGGVALAEGRVECPGLTRIEVQRRVAETVVAELADLLGRLRAQT